MLDNWKKQGEITRPEWIKWQWLATGECTTDGELVYVRGRLRPIEEAKEAAENFDIMAKAWIDLIIPEKEKRNE